MNMMKELEIFMKTMQRIKHNVRSLIIHFEEIPDMDILACDFRRGFSFTSAGMKHIILKCGKGSCRI